MPSVAHKIRRGLGLFLFASAIPIWLTIEAIAPQVVQAYTTRVDLSLERLPSESYQSLLTRAEAMARAGAQRSFDKDLLVTDVSIIVSVQNQGTVVPVMLLEVTRPQWRSQPDTQRWATYFKVARTLLFLGNSSKTDNSPTSQQPKAVQTPANSNPLTKQPSESLEVPDDNQSILSVPIAPPQKR
ncbi:MAG: hypothetical protein QNJ36_10150 [Calothrix sp. MO_167.B42]|nr:hypothetical protein [Calothrix sp. MO_167.B42]